MRIDLVLRESKVYTFEGYASKQVAAALEKRGTPYKRICLGDGCLQDYLCYVQESAPFAMISFTDLFPYERPFCDVIQVRQFFWVKHSLAEAAHYVNSSYGLVGLPYSCSMSNTVYLPHGVENLPSEERIFDTVLFSPLVDLDCLEKMWEDFYPKELVGHIHTALETGLPPIEAAKKVMHGELPTSTNHLLQALETYRKAEHTQQVINHFSGERLDVFGEHVGNNWLKRIPCSKRIHLHYKLPFQEYLSVLRQSKQIILNAFEKSWQTHALAAGCTPIGCMPEQEEPKSWEKQTETLIEFLHESEHRHPHV